MKYMLPFKTKSLRAAASVLLLAGLSGCASESSWLASDGPRTGTVETSGKTAVPIRVLDVDGDLAAKVASSRRVREFSEVFGTTAPSDLLIGAGDELEVAIWEAPPAVLFGAPVAEARSGMSASRSTALPEQMVAADGTISVPFAGQVKAAGRTTQQVGSDIVRRLQDKAHQPQVLVRMVRNHAANVTVVGEVTNSTRMPLTSRGERLLDALAAAGGVRQPVSKMSLQLTRGNQVESLPLETVIRDPRQNISLQPGDVVTSLFQPLSFTVLGATGKNEEINFESRGISLAQALARAGGLQDARADARGVFLFRLEQGQVLGQASGTQVPVVYRLNLKDPAAFFSAQTFPVQNGDLLYVSNAPAVELQKFLNIIVSALYPVANVVAVTK